MPSVAIVCDCVTCKYYSFSPLLGENSYKFGVCSHTGSVLVISKKKCLCYKLKQKKEDKK